MLRKVTYYFLSLVMFAALIFLITLVSCSNSSIVDPPADSKLNLTKSESKVLSSTSKFGFSLLKALSRSDKTNNIFISPLSVSTAFGMALNGAVGETYSEMVETLELNGLSIEEINEANKNLVEILSQVDPKVSFQIANSVWYRNDFAVLESYLSVNQNYYDAEINKADFNDPATATAINNWVSTKTNGKIETIIEDGLIDPAQVMFLINALYFKGDWKYQFNEENTFGMAFNLTDGTQVSVPAMYQKMKFNYFENDQIQIVDLPYGDSSFTMTVILPKTIDGIDETIEELGEGYWNELIGKMDREEITLRLPKLKYEFDINLKNILFEMGMKLAMTPLADFTKITPVGSIYIGDVIHKTFIEINEEGTEAAAVTSISFERTSSVGNEKYMIVDRPYIFAIREVSTNTVLFTGKILNPTLESNN